MVDARVDSGFTIKRFRCQAKGRAAKVALIVGSQAALTWLAAEKGRSANTLAAYRRDLNGYWAWLSNRGLGLDDVRGVDLDAYVGELRGRGLAPASVKRAPSGRSKS